MTDVQEEPRRPPPLGHQNTRVYLAFEGGGAKGLVHVGALKAIEDVELRIRGYAGTSAGAIVAALAAAGYKADDIVDPVGRSTILDGLNIANATRLFGRGGWLRVKFLGACLGCNALVRSVVLLAIALLVLVSIWLAGSEAPWLAPAVVVFWCLIVAWGAYILVGGLTTARTFRNMLATALKQRMLPSGCDRDVLFSDFGGRDKPTLKIVATDLSGSALRLFSPETSPGVAVADAVAASICLPFVFSIWKLEGRFYLDGGLVSNLPAWCFDEERAIDSDALTIAVEIAERTDPAARLSRRRWLGRAFRTAIFGSASLNRRAIGRLEVVSLDSDLDVLDFDVTKEKAFEIVGQATIAAQAKIWTRVFQVPALFRDACQIVSDLTTELLANDYGDLVSEMPPSARVRVALAVQEPGYFHSIRLRYGVGYEDCTDEAMLLPVDTSVTGKAWRDQCPVLYVSPFADEVALPGPENRQRRRLVWPDLKWLEAVPVSLGGVPSGVDSRYAIVVDSNIPLNEGHEKFKEFRDLLASKAVTILGMMSKAISGTMGRSSPGGSEGRQP